MDREGTCQSLLQEERAVDGRPSSLGSPEHSIPICKREGVIP